MATTERLYVDPEICAAAQDGVYRAPDIFHLDDDAISRVDARSLARWYASPKAMAALSAPSTRS